MKVLLLLVLAAYTGVSQSLVDPLAIEVSGESREFSFTNKESAFLYGETNSGNRTSWQGFNVFGFEFLDDYLLVIDGSALERTLAKTIVYPDYLIREYPGGITEQIRPVDSLAAFGVIVTSAKPIVLQFRPLFTDGRTSAHYATKADGGELLIARANHLSRTPKQNYAVWLAISAGGFSLRSEEWSQGNQFSPASLTSQKSKTHIISIAVGDTEIEAVGAARAYAGDPETFFRQRRARMEKLLNETYVQTDNVRFDKALAWAKLSLDALIMNQVTKGIFAGLPWFNNYWGRDTFISLPGACLVLGRFSEAKSILRSFAAFQNTDTASTDYGRIPNIVTTTDKAYNTADGTPRFAMMVEEYIQRSGDTAFIHEIYPIIKRSIEGTMKYHTDSLGFLTHGDAETWMDAVGPDGPWSPRGNRANDIQALWADQLSAGAWLAGQIGDKQFADEWQTRREKLVRNFTAFFTTDSSVVDHLNTDGSPDKQLRPNQIFTAGLLSETNRLRVLKSVVSDLTYEYGVASLWQEDENFHPYHQFDPYYPKDAAYHNGTVWTWVQGPVISELCRFGNHDLAFKITQNTVHQILDRGAVGSQSELLDALARPDESEPRPSGTFSQAWNLAEFIRNFYDDYLGARINRYDHTFMLQPRLPKTLGQVHARLNIDGRGVSLRLKHKEQILETVIDGSELRVGGRGVVSFYDDFIGIVSAEIPMKPRSVTRIELRNSDLTYYDNGTKANSPNQTIYPLIHHDLSLAVPNLRPNLRSLRGPDHPLIPHARVKARPQTTIIVTTSDDPIGDDTGVDSSGNPSEHYSYPQNQNFIRGCMDITYFSVAKDDSNAYFSLRFHALSNPGWHPEYGFQLTFVAIAIDLDGKTGSGGRDIKHNSSFMVPDEAGFERLVLVGGGVRIEDAEGKILAAYIPASPDAINPLGDAKSGTISFALPLSYLGRLDTGCKFTVLVGAQDDHGGAGLGEFRTVNNVSGEWSGGGRTGNGPNVYDTIVAGGK